MHHSPTGGAFGAYMFGVGATEMLGVLVTGEIWLKVPHTILVDWSGVLGPAVSAKDMMLALCGKLGLDGGQYQAIQYAGEAVSALSMQERSAAVFNLRSAAKPMIGPFVCFKYFNAASAEAARASTSRGRGGMGGMVVKP